MVKSFPLIPLLKAREEAVGKLGDSLHPDRRLPHPDEAEPPALLQILQDPLLPEGDHLGALLFGQGLGETLNLVLNLVGVLKGGDQEDEGEAQEDDGDQEERR